MSKAERFYRKQSEQPEVSPSTLAEILIDKELRPEELRASLAADEMSIPFKDRKIMFGAFIFIQSGIFRARELIDVMPKHAVDMRDMVVTNSSYEEMWHKFNVLQRPNFLEVAQGKKQKKLHREIGEELGLTEHEVDEISKYLIASGAINMSPRGRGRAAEFDRITDLVEKEDASWRGDGPRPTEKEIAEKLSVNEGSIRRARARNRIKNRSQIYSPRFSKKPNYEEVKERRTRVLEGLDRGLTNRQISLEYGIPFEDVRNDRAWLRKRKKVPAVIYSKNSNREKMRSLLQEYLETHPPGTIINLKEVQRSGVIPVSYSELHILYSEIASQQEVSPVRKVTRIPHG